MALSFVSALGGSGIVTFFCVTKITTDLTYIAQNLNFITTTAANGYGQAVKYDFGYPGNFLLYSYQGDSGVINCSQAFSSGTNIRYATYLYTQRSGLFDAATIGQPYTTTTPNTNRSLINGSLGSLNTDITGNYATTSALYSISGANDQNGQSMGELIVFNRALTDSEITQVNVYLIAKWGIGSGGTGTGSASGTDSGTATGTDTSIRYDNDPNSYLVQGQPDGQYYWANVNGTPELNAEFNPFEATNVNGPPVTGATKTVDSVGTVYNVRGTVTGDFITAGNNYVKARGDGRYDWCSISQVVEDPPVEAVEYNSFVPSAKRYNITWTVNISAE